MNDSSPSSTVSPLAELFPKHVGLFPNAWAKEPDEVPSLGSVLEQIKSGTWKEEVEILRRRLNQGHRKAYDESKRSLPAFTLSAACLTREKNVAFEAKFIGHSDYLQADFDSKENPQLDDLQAVKSRLLEDPHIGFIFISPSGQGIKAGVRIDGERHADSFYAAESYFLDTYGLQMDRSTKDPLRLCFVSYDPDLSFKEAAILPIPEAATTNGSRNKWHPPIEATADDVREMLSFIPPRPDYEDWLRIASAVWSVLPMLEGCQVLNQWSPEERAGEYTEKWRHKLGDIGVGTLVWYASQHGFDAREAARRKRWAGRIRFADPTRNAPRTGDLHTEDPSKDVGQIEITRAFLEECFRDHQRGDARLFAHIYRGKKLYDHYANIWRTYSEGVWLKDDMQQTLIEASDTVSTAFEGLMDTLVQEIEDSPPPDPKKDPRLTKLNAIQKRVQKLRSIGHLTGCLKFAESSLATAATRFDRNAGLLVVNNGVIDFTSGVFREHRHSDMATCKTPCDFDGDAECPRWNEFLNFFMDGDQGLIDYLARAVGYSLTSFTDKDVLFFLFGKGANGKSTFTSTLKLLLGGHMTTVPMEALLTRSSDAILDYRKAEMEGKRVVLTDEIPENRKLNESSIKSLVGGDTITARRPYEKPYNFEPTHKLWLVGNHKPRIDGTDYGIWRRVHLIPWLITMPEEERRPRHEILAEFRAELPGILNWAIRGFVDMEDFGGLRPPKQVLDATREYQSDSDQFARFLDERTQRDLVSSVSLTDLREAYLAWCQDEGEVPKYQTNQKVSHYMRDLGFDIQRRGIKKERFVLGLEITPCS